ELGELLKDAAEFDYSVAVALRGSADSTGDTVINTALAERRAVVAAGILAASGIAARIVQESDDVVTGGQQLEDVSERHIEVELQLESPPGRP
ncbi:MAG: hypothetical protein WBM61_18155, partial [Woeseiaceae bacterium]